MALRRLSRQSKSFVSKKRNRSLWMAGAVVSSMAALIYIASALSSASAFTVTTVRISGVEAEDEQIAIRAAALEALEGEYLDLFAKANVFLYPKSAITSKVKSTLASVNEVKISRDGLHALNISVIERDPAALVCTMLPDFNGTDLSLEDPGSCYFADETGYLYKKAPSFSGNVYHRYYVPELVAEATSTAGSLVGKSATSTSEFEALERFYDTVSVNNITADAILMKSGSEYELYARNPVGSSGSSSESGPVTGTVVIYFNTVSSLEEQTANLISFWKHMIEEARAKNEDVRFDSIDVRYGANVFYRENK